MNELHDTQNCKAIISSISDYVDGELSPELCSALERHLSSCENCQIVINTLRKTIELYHMDAESGSLPGEVRQRLFVKLHLDDFLN